jgi:hypothetical protein
MNKFFTFESKENTDSMKNIVIEKQFDATRKSTYHENVSAVASFESCCEERQDAAATYDFMKCDFEQVFSEQQDSKEATADTFS